MVNRFTNTWKALSELASYKQRVITARAIIDGRPVAMDAASDSLRENLWQRP